MTGGFEGEPKVEINGMANITGGGVPEKLGRMLKPSGLGAYIYEPFEPCKLILHCQEVGNLVDEKAYNEFGMGQGFMIATPEPEKAIRISKNHSLEAKVVGGIKKSPGIDIESRGYYDRGKILKFEF
jgi:phosphoribosylaminoimidazole (AIR) synthetase